MTYQVKIFKWEVKLRNTYYQVSYFLFISFIFHNFFKIKINYFPCILLCKMCWHYTKAKKLWRRKKEVKTKQSLFSFSNGCIIISRMMTRFWTSNWSTILLIFQPYLIIFTYFYFGWEWNSQHHGSDILLEFFCLALTHFKRYLKRRELFKSL